MKKLTVIISVVLSLVASACCGGGDGSSLSSGGSTANPGSAELSALEGRMSPEGYGEGPGAQQIAREVKQELMPGDHIAVRVTPAQPGTPQRIVIIIRFGDLSTIDDEMRRDYLVSIGELLDNEFGGRQSEVAIGIRGRVLFGAVAHRSPGSAWTYDVSSVASQGPLERLLAPPTAVAAPATPAQAPAAPVPATAVPTVPAAPATPAQ